MKIDPEHTEVLRRQRGHPCRHYIEDWFTGQDSSLVVTVSSSYSRSFSPGRDKYGSSEMWPKDGDVAYALDSFGIKDSLAAVSLIESWSKRY